MPTPNATPNDHPTSPGAAPHTGSPGGDTGPSEHGKGGAICRRWEAEMPGGRSVQPHGNREDNVFEEDLRRRKIEARFTDKIG